MKQRRYSVGAGVAITLVLALLSIAYADSPPQRAIFVVEGSCLTAVTLMPGSRLEIPLDKDGRPESKMGTLVGVRVSYRKDCGKYEVSR